MGTNYYIKGYDNPEKNERDEDSPDWHIGKRSAAGLFCFKCDITLCKTGPEGVHYGTPWHDACPTCGKKYDREGLEESSGGLELGFNKNPTAIKEGVSTASSFSFAMDFTQIVKKLQDEFGEEKKAFDENEKTIVDEYKREFSYIEFIELLTPIPTSLRFRHSIGEFFS